MEPVFFEFGKGELGGAPAGDDGPVPAWGEVGLVFADDFTQTATDGVALDGAANFFASDETKAEMREFVDGSGGKHQRPTGLGLALLTKLGEVTGLLQPQVRGQTHGGEARRKDRASSSISFGCGERSGLRRRLERGAYGLDDDDGG